jgi:hypothetical protein
MQRCDLEQATNPTLIAVYLLNFEALHLLGQVELISRLEPHKVAAIPRTGKIRRVV